MRNLTTFCGILLVGLVGSVGCQKEGLSSSAGGGGATGGLARGGATGAGGVVATGGNVGTGGAFDAAGPVSTGGSAGLGGGGGASGSSVQQGGARGSGGIVGAGGGFGSGGVVAAGGRAVSGGTLGTGAVTGSGGSKGTGGSTGSSGSGGIAGVGGHDGGGGQGGQAIDGGETCDELVSDYATALVVAKQCTLGADDQCTQLVENTLSSCPGCEEYVNDTTKLTAIRAQWTDQGCALPVPCAVIICLLPAPSSCVATGASPLGGTVCTATAVAAPAN